MAGCEWGAQTKNFHWYQRVEPIKDAYVVNLGNMFMTWHVFLISSFLSPDSARDFLLPDIPVFILTSSLPRSLDLYISIQTL
jgi:hypothetical protein